MVYEVTKEFIKVNESSGTVQNTSTIHTLEMSHTNEHNSGVIVPPICSRAFDDTGGNIWIRCIDGAARARVVPFKFDKNQSGVIVAGEQYSIAQNSDISGMLNNIFGMEE